MDTGDMKIRQAILVASAVCVNFVSCLRYGYNYYFAGKFVPDALTSCCILFGFLLLDVIRLKPAKSHSFHSLVTQYSTQKLFQTIGNILYFRLKKLCASVEIHQREVLRSIIEQNKKTKVAKAFEVHKIKSVEEFRSKIPITRYSNYEKFSMEVENTGSADVFFPGHANYIALTSGTTSGKTKKFPKNIKIMKKTMGKWLCLAQKIFLDIPNNNFLRKWLTIRTSPRTFLSKSGIRCGPISGLASDLSITFYVIPKDLAVREKEEDELYINLLFGLLEEEICNLFFSSSQIALQSFKLLERRWEELLNDIDTGVLSYKLDISDHLRTKIEKYLKGGNSARAEFLRQELSVGFKDIIPRIWPTCPGLFCMATGSFRTQANILKEQYLGNLPIFSPFHGGTETVYGINIDLENLDVTYLAMTTYIFFEFIPVEEIENENPKTLLAHEVQDGALYELVVTTFEGLYRYRTEDVVQIRGFYGTIPKYRFIRRAGDILSASTERVPEVFLAAALRTVTSALNRSIAEFTSTESVHVENCNGDVQGQLYYVVFVEFHGDQTFLSEKDKLKVDEELCRLHEVYSMFRASGKMLPVKVLEVETNTFERFRDFYLTMNTTTSIMQYKLPRILRRPENVNFLLQHQSFGAFDKREVGQ